MNGRSFNTFKSEIGSILIARIPALDDNDMEPIFCLPLERSSFARSKLNESFVSLNYNESNGNWSLPCSASDCRLPKQVMREGFDKGDRYYLHAV